MVADRNTGASSQPSSSFPLLFSTFPLPGLGTNMASWAKLSLPGLHRSSLPDDSAGDSSAGSCADATDGNVTFMMSCGGNMKSIQHSFSEGVLQKNSMYHRAIQQQILVLMIEGKQLTETLLLYVQITIATSDAAVSCHKQCNRAARLTTLLPSLPLLAGLPDKLQSFILPRFNSKVLLCSG